MQRFRHLLRTCLILAMIPLTVVSGRVAPGCICSDGHFEPLCNGGKCCSDPATSATTDSCHCRNCCQSTQGPAKSCCLRATHPSHLEQTSDGENPQKCCHPLTLSPMVPEGDAAVHSNVELPSFNCSSAVDLPLVIVEQVAYVPLIDSGPPRGRLYVLQSLLI